MIKKFLNKYLDMIKEFFISTVKKIRSLQWKKPDFSKLKIALSSHKENSSQKEKPSRKEKPKSPKKIKLTAPKWMKTFGAALANFFSQKPVSRLAVGICALALGSTLIFWDLGLIDLPFLVRHNRREPIKETQTQEESTTTTKKKNDSEQGFANAALALETIRSLYAYAGVNVAKTPITDLPYDRDTMTLTKQILPEGNFSAAMGFVLKTENGKDLLFTANDMQEVLDSDGFHLTHYRTTYGNPVFTSDHAQGYFIFDGASRTFSPTDFDPARYPHASITFALPLSYGRSDENKELFTENGLYGYKGTYLDGKKTKKFTVDPIYTTAFAYSEGFAVMADAEGRVTIRNERGEAVFTEFSFLLPDFKNEEALGFTYFDGGLLRVIIAGYNAEGKLTSRRETMINTRGQEVTVPDGYRVISLHEGILLVTDGEYYGYLTTNGAWLAPPVYRAASPFFEGLAVVTDKDGKVGLIDNKGKTVLPCAFESISNFSDGHALCYSKATGWYLLTKVNGVYYHDPSLEDPNFTKSTITRGPQNTFDYEPDEIIVLLPPETTAKRTTVPENTTSQVIK